MLNSELMQKWTAQSKNPAKWFERWLERSKDGSHEVNPASWQDQERADLLAAQRASDYKLVERFTR
jgi:hypothetical protein